ncbi:hypothetical protein ACN4EG_24150 [Alkalinema pantanalense CENA528]|uniref:hypothetical protein n=1 Tax=Alkalinema pantanalense TaxID=1620705 RepID=UPI003D6EA202
MKVANLIQFNNLQGDVFGRVTVAIVFLLLVLAFGITFSVGSIGGLSGAIFIGLFAALFCDAPLFSETTGSMTVSPVYKCSLSTCS